MKFNKPISSFLNPWVVLMARHRPTMNKSGHKDNFRVAGFDLILVPVATYLPGEVNAARLGNCSEEFRRPTSVLAPTRDPASLHSAWKQSMEILPPIYERSGAAGKVIEARIRTAVGEVMAPRKRPEAEKKGRSVGKAIQSQKASTYEADADSRSPRADPSPDRRREP